MKNVYKKMLIILVVFGLMGCAPRKAETDDAGACDEVNKPAASEEADYSSIVSPQEIKEYFDVRTARVEDTEMRNKLIMYSDEEKAELCNTLAEHLPQFWNGGGTYQLDEALIAYEAALSLSYTSDDIDDDYHYIGYFASHALLELYGIEFSEESIDDICVGIRQSCIKLQELGYLNEDFNPTSWYN